MPPSAVTETPSEPIPALDDCAVHEDASRGEVFLEIVMRDAGIPIADRRVIDMGAGFGSIALAAAQQGADVLALDWDTERLAVARERWRRSSTTAAGSFSTVECNLLNAPVPRATADVVFLIGVVEYAGLWDPSRSVEELQLELLREARGLLRPGGVLVMGTKNRLWPKTILRDPHVGLPLVSALPRRLADAVTRIAARRTYRHHLRSARGWDALLKRAGFASVETLTPIYSYQFPIALLSRATLKNVAAAHESRSNSLPVAYVNAAALGRGIARFAKRTIVAAGTAQNPFSHGIVCVATTPSEGERSPSTFPECTVGDSRVSENRRQRDPMRSRNSGSQG